MSETRILVSGLPGTGKTTFIAALWCYVKSDATEKSLTVNSLAGVEHEYLNSIANDWMEYKIPGRSLQNTHFEKVILPLKRVSDSQAVTLEIPDIAGEKFRDHFDMREWSFEFDSLLHDVTGILVFVNPLAANNQPKFIADAIESEALFEENAMNADPPITQGGSAKKEASEVPPKPTLTNWDIKFVPNQVKIVEGLQFLHHHKTLQKPLKLSIIISAWDAVPGAEELEPEQWLENNLPMLSQYLQCNVDKFTSCFFGVSAQGCDYEKDAEVDALIEKPLHDRVKIKQGKNTDTDITQTIIWMT
jgi:hypothetical protein